MTEKLFAGFVSVFGRKNTKFEKEMLTYAKTEFRNDWRYAYQHMIENNGKAPRMGVYN